MTISAASLKPSAMNSRTVNAKSDMALDYHAKPEKQKSPPA